MTQCRAKWSPTAGLKGFAYLWLLFSIAVVGLGSSLAMEIHTTTAQRDKEKELLSIGNQFRRAIGRYYETQAQGKKSEYPSSLEDLLLDPRSITPQRHLRKIYVDPMTGKSEWGVVKFGGRIVGIHSLSDAAPIKQLGFNADDSMLNGKQKYSQWMFTYPANFIQAPPSGAVTGLTPTGTSEGVPPPPPGQTTINGPSAGLNK